jgi:hypothetical protein
MSVPSSGEYYFGGGPGWLSARVAAVAKRHGAALVNFTDDRCNCGYGCPPRTRKESRRHWFAIPHRGEPFNQQREAEVLKAIAPYLPAGTSA